MAPTASRLSELRPRLKLAAVAEPAAPEYAAEGRPRAMSWMHAAVRAFDDAVAVVDPRRQTIVGCTAAFARQLGLVSRSWRGLLNVLPGLARVIEQCPDERSEWKLAALRQAGRDDGREGGHESGRPTGLSDAALEGQIEVAPSPVEGQFVLRLRPAGPDGSLMRRHIQDRERMVFQSRSLGITEMATTLAHELNQPLGTISNVLHGMKRRLETAAAADGSAPRLDLPDLLRGIQYALDQSGYAAGVIARIRSHTLARRPERLPMALPELLQRCAGLLSWDLEQLEVHLRTDIDASAASAVAAGDAVMLQQVIVNLMRNGIDAMLSTPPGQRQLCLGLRHRPSLGPGLAEEWVIEVSDSGCGLGEDAEQRLFTPFTSSKPDGMGIGLNICRSFVEWHAGRLWFTRHEGVPGSTFHVALPVHHAAPTAPAHA